MLIRISSRPIKWQQLMKRLSWEIMTSTRLKARGREITIYFWKACPNVKKNLISTNLLCKKGLKVVIEADNVIISKNGIFV